MEEQLAANQNQVATPPSQVWRTLTKFQQEAVLATVVQICQHIVVHYRREAANEPVTIKPGQ